VYVQHVGQSDKPVFPLVLASVTPTPQERLGVLRDPGEAQFAQIVLVSAKSLQRIVEQAAETLRGVREPADPHAFGTFRIVVVSPPTPDASRASVLSRQDTLRFLRDIVESLSPPDRQTLTDALAPLRARLGEETKP
jgi:hypothetical protein